MPTSSLLLVLPILLSAQVPVAPAGAEAAGESGALPEPAGFDRAAELLAAGRSALVAGDLGSATASLRAALEQAPGESVIRTLLARTLNDRQKFEEALRVLDVGPAPAPSAWLHTERGRACMRLERTQEAEQAFRVALASYPGCGGARLELARLLLDGERLEECAVEVARLEADAVDEPAVVLLCARLLEAQGAVDGAIMHLEAALEREVGDEHLRLALGRLLIESGRARDAWRAVEPVLDGPLDSRSLLQVARVAQLAERPIDALSILGSILVHDPTHAEALHDMLELVEDHHELVALLAERRVLSTPDDPYGWGELLEEHIRAGQFEEVLAALATAPAPVLADPEVRLHEATALRRLGRLEEARPRLEALCAEHGAPEDWYQLGMLEYAARRFAEAEAALARAARDEYIADAQYVRALCLEQLGKNESAAGALDAAVASRPDFIEAWLRLGNECRLRLGDADRARRAYRRYLALGGDDPQIRRWVEEAR